MKTTKMLMIAALGAVLASCGSKSGGGKPNFADNEYAVRTVEAQGTELQTTYPATIKGIQEFRFVQRYLVLSLKFVYMKVRP